MRNPVKTPVTKAEAAVPDPVHQAAEVAAALEATGRSAGAGAAAEDVLGSAREAPGIGSGAVGAQVPQDIISDRVGPGGYFTPMRAGAEALIRTVVRDEMDRVLGRGAYGAAGTATAADDGHDLEIISRVDKFMRGGIAHPAAATPRRSRDFTPAQLRAIETEPTLIVRRLRPFGGVEQR